MSTYFDAATRGTLFVTNATDPTKFANYAFTSHSEVSTNVHQFNVSLLSHSFSTPLALPLFQGEATKTFYVNDGATGNAKNVAIFTVDASSAIATGAKTDSLYRLPHDATMKNFDVKVNGTGGFTAAIYIAGTDFGTPLTGRITGCSLGTTGATGSSTVFNQAAITAGNFLFLDVFTNASGSSAAQAFLTFESR